MSISDALGLVAIGWTLLGAAAFAHCVIRPVLLTTGRALRAPVRAWRCRHRRRPRALARLMVPIDGADARKKEPWQN